MMTRKPRTCRECGQPAASKYGRLCAKCRQDVWQNLPGAWYVPTPDEIAAACAEIRQRHYDAKRRSGGEHPQETPLSGIREVPVIQLLRSKRPGKI